MKKVILSILFISIFLFSASLQAQISLGAGLNLGLYGPGVQVSISPLPFLKARVGLNYMGYNYSINEAFSGDSQTDPMATGTVDGEIYDAKFSFLNGSVLADFYPAPRVPISITGGFYLGQNKVGINGNADDKFQYIGVKVNPEANGDFSGDILIGNVVKPYLGLGFGNTLSENSNLSFRFDIGAIYQGSPKFKSSYVEGTYFDIDDLDTSIAGENDQMMLALSLMKFWPQLSFTLTYKIF